MAAHAADDALLGADETHAMAQGNLLVGGLGVEGGDGSSLVVNVPTVGRIPRGASVERMVETPFLNNDHMCSICIRVISARRPVLPRR